MLQQQSYVNRAMPLLLGLTPKTQIEEGVKADCVSYDAILQITNYDMAAIGTKSLKSSMTKYGNSGSKIDKKNEIDDTKYK